MDIHLPIRHEHEHGIIRIACVTISTLHNSRPPFRCDLIDYVLIGDEPSRGGGGEGEVYDGSDVPPKKSHDFFPNTKIKLVPQDTSS